MTPNPNMSVRVLAFLCTVLLMAGVVGLATISDDQSPGSPSAAVALAAERTYDGPSVKVRSTANVLVRDRPFPSMGMEMTGTMDFKANRGYGTVKGQGVEVEFKTTETTYYVRFVSPLPVDRDIGPGWYAIAADKVPKDANPLAGLSGPSFGAGDASGALGMLRKIGAVKEASSVGKREVGGVSTSHYHVVINGKAMLEAAAKEMGLAPEDLSSVDFKDPQMEIFVGDDGLVRRHEFRMTLAAGAQAVELTAVSDFSDFGTPVDVNPPRDAEVTRLGSYEEFEDLLSGGR